MSKKDDDRFNLRIRPPGERGKSLTSPFAQRVIRSASKAGPISGIGANRVPSRKRPGPRIGRGHAAARMSGQRIGPRSRRVIIKTRLVVFKRASPRSVAMHLRYIQRDGVTRAGGRGELYSATTDHADAEAFESASRQDRHQFRFIVSPEDAAELGDLKAYTRQLMSQVETDLGTRLEWVAVDHWDTDNPHTHIVLRGRGADRQDLVIAGDYIAYGMRHRAAEVATEWLGQRTELEILRSLNREVEQERWTSLDKAIQRDTVGGLVDMREMPKDAATRGHHLRRIGRLERLATMGLSSQVERGIWSISPKAEQTLRTMGERGDIIRTMQRAFTRERREFAIFDNASASPITGRVVANGMHDELNERGYLILDGLDGRAHHVPLGPKIDVSTVPTGAIVTVRSAAVPLPADLNVAALAQDGIYRTAHHMEVVRATHGNRPDPHAVVEAHVRRLEALRRAGIVERIEEGVWRIPANLPEVGQRHDAQRSNGAQVEINSFVPIDRQTRAMGATWLDRQLIAGNPNWAAHSFGVQARQALAERQDFLIAQGLAERHGERVVLARNLLATLRSQDLESAARTVETDTGLRYSPTSDGATTSGVYRGFKTLASGRFAMLVF